MATAASLIPPAGRASQATTGLALAGLVCGGWLALHLAGLLLVPVRWATLPLVIVIMVGQCWLSVGLFIVAHDAMHGSLAPGRPRLNGAIGATLLFLYAGFAWRRMRAAHFAHHRAPGSAADPDFDADHPTQPVRWYLTFLRRYFGWQSVLYVTALVWAYRLLLGVPIANLVLLYSVPAIASSIQLFYFGTYRPHRHAEDAFADAHHARSEDFSPLVSLVTCFHFGYHHEHHVHPGAPWWALPAHRRAARSGAEQ